MGRREQGYLYEIKRQCYYHQKCVMTLTSQLFVTDSWFHMRNTILMLLVLSYFSRVRLCATPDTAAQQAPPSLGFSRQEHWSGLPFPSPMHETEK